jgi:hypothetical protein
MPMGVSRGAEKKRNSSFFPRFQDGYACTAIEQVSPTHVRVQHIAFRKQALPRNNTVT